MDFSNLIESNFFSILMSGVAVVGSYAVVRYQTGQNDKAIKDLIATVSTKVNKSDFKEYKGEIRIEMNEYRKEATENKGLLTELKSEVGWIRVETSENKVSLKEIRETLTAILTQKTKK